MDVEFQFLEGDALVLFFLVGSNGVPAFLIFFKGENNNKNNFMFFIFFLMQKMFDGIFGIELVEVNDESLFELYIFGIVVELQFNGWIVPVEKADLVLFVGFNQFENAVLVLELVFHFSAVFETLLRG